MAALADISKGNTTNLKTFLQDVAKSFSEQEMKDVINCTKNDLRGDYNKLPDDDLTTCFELLRKHGLVSETDTSAIEFYAETFRKEDATNGPVTKKINEFKRRIHTANQGTAPKGQIIGRSEDVHQILDELRARPQASNSREIIGGINLHGEGGVGKTWLAKEIAKKLCLERDCKSIVVNLRGIEKMKQVYSAVLHKFHRTPLFCSPERIYDSIESLRHDLVLIFDNAEDLLLNLQDFKGFITNMIQRDEKQRLKLVLTSRLILHGVAQFANYFVKPFEKNASRELLFQKAGVELNIDVAVEIAEKCSNKPLLLKGIAAILKENLAAPEEVLAKIEKNAKASCKATKVIQEKVEQQTQTEREVEPKQPATELSNNDKAVFQEMFSKLAKPLRNSLVKLSLLCQDFPLHAAQQILGRSTTETRYYLNILISKGCVESKRDEHGEKMFDLHPLIQKFLENVRNTPEYQAVYQEAKVLFCSLFKNKLKELALRSDTDFIQVFSDFEKERPNFEQLLKLSPEREFLSLLPDVREFYLLPCLLEPLLTVGEREYLFHKWADIAVKEGNWPFAANLKSWESLQVNQQRGGNEARAVLDEGELFLKKASEQLSDQYQGAKSMYLYAEGKIYYKSSHSDATQKNFYCHKALESLQQSLELTEKVYGKHTATARCLNEIGNCYNELQNLEMASTYFERAYKMREELSSSNGHNDMAVYLNQIAVIHEKTGVKLLKEKNTEDEGKRKLTKAIQLFQKALDLEKKLKIDGYSSTALFKRNMANAYLYLDEPEKAWKPALEAYEIRERVLGTHPDTVRSLFQLGNVKYWAEDYQAALEYFYKAYDMEESLPEGNHSAVRQLIKKRILVSGGTLKYGDPMNPGILRSLGSFLYLKTGNIVQSIANLVAHVIGIVRGKLDDDEEDADEEFLDCVSDNDTPEQNSGHTTEEEFMDAQDHEDLVGSVEKAAEENRPVAQKCVSEETKEHKIEKQIGRTISALAETNQSHYLSSEASISNTASVFIGQNGGTVSTNNVSVCVPPDSVQEQTEIKVTLEDSAVHYQPFFQANLQNKMIFAAPVIKLEPHGLAFPIPATVRVELDKHKHPDDKVVVLHVVEKEGKRYWEDVTDKSIFKDGKNEVVIELMNFSFIEILFVEACVQIKHILTKLNILPIEYKLSVFGKHNPRRHPYSDLKLVFMSSDIYNFASYREDKNCSITQLRKEGFEEYPCNIITLSSDKEAVYNGEQIEIILSLGRDMKLAGKAENAERRQLKVDSSIWRSTGYTAHFRLERVEEIKLISGKIEVKGAQGHHLEAGFHEKDFSGYLKKILSLENIVNLLPVAKILDIESRWTEVATEWEDDENQIKKILSIWKQKNANEDPCKIKELVRDIQSAEHLVSKRGKLHIQHVRNLANKVEGLDKSDHDCIRSFNKELKDLTLFLLGDCCIEICADEEEIDKRSQDFVRLLLKRDELVEDFGKQLQQVIDADVEEMAPQEFLSIVAPLIQLVKESYKVLPKTGEPNGLWGLPATFVELSEERIKSGVKKLKRGRIVTEISRILEEMCLLNRSKTRNEEEIKIWGACACITNLLKELDFFLQSGRGLKLKKRIEVVAKCVREILDEDAASTADVSTVNYYGELASNLLEFAKFDPSNLVQFKIEPSSRVSFISRGLKHDKTKDPSSFSESFEITKERDKELDLNVFVHVNMERHTFKTGEFQAKVKLSQEERECVELLLRKEYQFLGVAAKTEQHLAETITILCSKRQEHIHKFIDILKQKFPNVNPARVEVENCPLLVRSCTNDRYLKLKLLYMKGEDAFRIESGDFETCVGEDGLAMQYFPETEADDDVPSREIAEVHGGALHPADGTSSLNSVLHSIVASRQGSICNNCKLDKTWSRRRSISVMSSMWKCLRMWCVVAATKCDHR